VVRQAVGQSVRMRNSVSVVELNQMILETKQSTIKNHESSYSKQQHLNQEQILIYTLKLQNKQSLLF
jgi:hypothetical protein